MINKLQKVKIEEVDAFIPDKNTLRRVKEEKSLIFRVANGSVQQDITADPLVDLEITLRKCKRVGVFRK